MALDLKEDNTMPLKEYIIIFEVVIGAGFFEGDFKSCFDTLSHDFILKQLKGFPYINVVKRFLEAGYVDNGVFNETEEGTPQGGLLYPIISKYCLTWDGTSTKHNPTRKLLKPTKKEK